MTQQPSSRGLTKPTGIMPGDVPSLERALSPGASAREIAAAAERLESLVVAAHEGDSQARSSYLAMLYALEEGRYARDLRTRVVRHFLTERVFAIQERYIEEAHLENALSTAEFRERIRGGLDRLAKDVYLSKSSVSRNPMLEYLFAGSPTLAEVKVWIRHAWFVAKSFYKLIADFAPLLDIEYAGSTYSNLVEESGYQPAGSTPHIVLLRQLVSYFDIGFDEEPSTPEAHAYLTNRFRCVRHPRREWGLGVLWAFEAVTSEKHAQSLRMLQKLGVPDEVGEFYRVHMAADEGHSNAFLDVIDRYVVTAEQQRNFLTSLSLHTQLRKAYFEQIWQEIRAVRGPGTEDPVA